MEVFLLLSLILTKNQNVNNKFKPNNLFNTITVTFVHFKIPTLPKLLRFYGATTYQWEP